MQSPQQIVCNECDRPDFFVYESVDGMMVVCRTCGSPSAIVPQLDGDDDGGEPIPKPAKKPLRVVGNQK